MVMTVGWVIIVIPTLKSGRVKETYPWLASTGWIWLFYVILGGCHGYHLYKLRSATIIRHGCYVLTQRHTHGIFKVYKAHPDFNWYPSVLRTFKETRSIYLYIYIYVYYIYIYIWHIWYNTRLKIWNPGMLMAPIMIFSHKNGLTKAPSRERCLRDPARHR